MRRFTLAVLLIVLCTIPNAVAAKRPAALFEATITGLEPWPTVRVSCGVNAIYRLAEYKVDFVYQGRIRQGEILTIKHLACNGNELDDLAVGNKVMVSADELPKAETQSWKKQSEQAKEPVSVRYRARTVGKILFPTAGSLR